MLTFKGVVMPHEQKKDKTYNVKIQITYQRRVKRISTSIFVKPEDLTKSFKIKNPDITKQVDSLIECYRSICAGLQIELNDYTLDDIVSFIKEERNKVTCIDFIQFSREWTATSTCKGAKNYKSAINAFVEFLGTDSLDINKLSREMLCRFKDYLSVKREKQVALLKKQGKRIPSNRMVSLYLGSLRHLFNLAKKQYNDYDKGIIIVRNSPFENLNIPKQEASRKRALDHELIKAIWSLPYKYKANGEEKTCVYNLAKDSFIMSFCLIGMNSADLHTATILEDDTIIYNRQKTSERRSDNALMKVKIQESVTSLVDKYKDHTGERVFDFHRKYSTPSSFNRAINKGLKEIGDALGIEDLEFYSARHSWATIAINKVGIDKYTVHSALNHLDESMKVTDIYIERDFSSENSANAKVLTYVFG